MVGFSGPLTYIDTGLQRVPPTCCKTSLVPNKQIMAEFLRLQAIRSTTWSHFQCVRFAYWVYYYYPWTSLAAIYHFARTTLQKCSRWFLLSLELLSMVQFHSVRLSHTAHVFNIGYPFPKRWVSPFGDICGSNWLIWGANSPSFRKVYYESFFAFCRAPRHLTHVGSLRSLWSWDKSSIRCSLLCILYLFIVTPTTTYRCTLALHFYQMLYK